MTVQSLRNLNVPTTNRQKVAFKGQGENHPVPAIASFIVPGAGQAMKGEVKKGIGTFLGVTALSSLAAVASLAGQAKLLSGKAGQSIALSGAAIATGLTATVIWFKQIADAYSSPKKN